MITEIKDLKVIDNFFNYIIINNFSKTYGYYIENKLIGFINFSIIYDRAELNYIWINEKYRKKGFAKKLIEKMIDDCKNLINITLEVAIDNVYAINLYSKYGFKVVTKRVGYYNGKDAFLMIRK